MVGVNESARQGNTLFTHTISTEKALREHLTPSGVAVDNQALLCDLLFDNLALPGAVCKPATDGSLEQLTSTMTAMTANSRADEVGTKDFQWCNVKRASFSTVKNQEELYEYPGVYKVFGT